MLCSYGTIRRKETEEAHEIPESESLEFDALHWLCDIEFLATAGDGDDDKNNYYGYVGREVVYTSGSALDGFVVTRCARSKTLILLVRCLFRLY